MKKNLGQSNSIILDTYIDLFYKSILEVCQLEMHKPSNINFARKENTLLLFGLISILFVWIVAILKKWSFKSIYILHFWSVSSWAVSKTLTFFQSSFVWRGLVSKECLGGLHASIWHEISLFILHLGFTKLPQWHNWKTVKMKLF